MSWVKETLTALQAGEDAQVRPIGGSMRGRIESGQLVTIAPVRPDQMRVDDVVFIRWKGNYLLHVVKDRTDEQLLIGNNLGKVNGWTSAQDVLGVVTHIAD
ncbi:MAG: hypothetical protein QGG36_04405 [Pirellulaceae bacterium]|jgi:hypothetical protein|nr:hypothetical protein [Pirellulaceae bacterium]MDP7015012.1 hypothetical protein [Pirellulaceae bacterium]